MQRWQTSEAHTGSHSSLFSSTSRPDLLFRTQYMAVLTADSPLPIKRETNLRGRTTGALSTPASRTLTAGRPARPGCKNGTLSREMLRGCCTTLHDEDTLPARPTKNDRSLPRLYCQ